MTFAAAASARESAENLGGIAHFTDAAVSWWLDIDTLEQWMPTTEIRVFGMTVIHVVVESSSVLTGLPSNDFMTVCQFPRNALKYKDLQIGTLAL